ncbi:calcineurin-like phosphoesterase, partial [Aureobasidium melanogenum]
MIFDNFWLSIALAPAVLAAQPSAPEPVKAPLRELPWGQLNFLATTDTHGWHGGHLQEPQYSADWGDYISFAHHLRQKADNDGSDLLLVDTGDRVEGNGLYDASNPKGQYTFDIFKHQNIDIITSGNHELYKKNSSDNEYYYTVPNFKEAYIASNLDIYNPDTGKLQPLAQRYRRFTTKNQGIRIMAFGFLFNFQGNANNTVVQRVEDTIKEKWFQDAIREKDVDLFVVAGHVPVSDSHEFDAIYKAIRSVAWDTPIAFFGGHTHIRDYHKFDKISYGLESGRYMETLGFMSISGLDHHKNSSEVAATPEFKRRYIDNNLYSLHRHSGKNETTFPTEAGRNVSASISAARKHLNLDHTYGCAPRDYWLNRAPYPSDSSILTWLENEVLPDTARNATKSPQLVITNTGAMRFDIFEGPFTIDTTFLVSPFTSGFHRLKNVPYKAARQLLQLLNNEGKILLSEMMVMSAVHRDLGKFTPRNLWELAPPKPPVTSWTQQEIEDDITLDETLQRELGQEVLKAAGRGKHDTPLVPGYTTIDDAGKDGDDTIHAPIRFYDVPNCIQAEVNLPSDKKDLETVDIVYNEFIERWILLALRFLGESYGVEDVETTFDGMSFTDVLSEWVHKNWAC